MVTIIIFHHRWHQILHQHRKNNVVYQYNEVTGYWSTLPITSLQSGIGYNLDQTPESDGLISFTGPLVTTDPILIDATSPYRDVITGSLQGL